MKQMRLMTEKQLCTLTESGGAPMISDQIDAAYALIPSGEGKKYHASRHVLDILGKTGDEKSRRQASGL